MPTEKQNRVISKTLENMRNKKPKSKGKILDESGYSKNVSKAPSIVYDSKAVKDGVKGIIKQLEQERQRAIDNLKGKINKAGYNHIITGIDVLTKNIQLLSGEATEKKEIVLEDDLKTEIARELLDRG